MPKVYILHENKEWAAPLKNALFQQNISYQEWHMAEGQFNLNVAPPEGVFYSKMSASAYTRGHAFAHGLAAPVLSWLNAHGRRIINSRRALQLELRKAEQYVALQQFGLKVPQSIVAVGEEAILNAASQFVDKPFILKPNCGGKGFGVKLFHSRNALEGFLKETSVEEITIDGVVVLQEYIKPPKEFITRMEFIDGKFYYAVRVNTSEGFELCPADVCEIDLTCTIDGSRNGKATKFQIIEDFSIPEIAACEAFLAANDIEIAGMEFVNNEVGERFFYDVNTNTNYNTDAEYRSNLKVDGISTVAAFLGRELKKLYSITSSEAF